MKTITDFELCEALKTFDPNARTSHAVLDPEVMDVLRSEGCIDERNRLTDAGRTFMEEHDRPYRACKPKGNVAP